MPVADLDTILEKAAGQGSERPVPERWQNRLDLDRRNRDGPERGRARACRRIGDRQIAGKVPLRRGGEAVVAESRHRRLWFDPGLLCQQRLALLRVVRRLLVPE